MQHLDRCSLLRGLVVKVLELPLEVWSLSNDDVSKFTMVPMYRGYFVVIITAKILLVLYASY